MHRAAIERYCCPYSGRPLQLGVAEDAAGEEVTRGVLVCGDGHEYQVLEGMPHLVSDALEIYGASETREREYYESTAEAYDEALDWLFESFRENERTVRSQMIDLLEISADHRVLETGAGTCRDTVLIADRLGAGGELFVQDLSPSMLSIGRDRMQAGGMLDGSHGRVEFFVGNAAHLPFADAELDAAFHFGGFNVFTDKRQALAEMARVVRVGGRVVVGDEGIAPWHRQSEYGVILMNSNPLYKHEPPLDLLPETAREASVRWLIGNAFYVIAFRVGAGLPEVDLDLPIKGGRGGTHRTRYYGRLEGVTPETKELAERAAKESGLSVHEWLDRAVRTAASDALKRS